MNTKPLPFESGRSLLGQVTEKRMNALVRSIPRLRFSGGGVRVSYLGDQVFVEFPSSKTPSISPHPLWVYNASKGSTPAIGVTPGAFNGTIIPTIGGAPINVQSGTPLAYPTLTLSGTDKYVWFEIAYSASMIATAVAINHGTTIPTASIVVGTGGTDYYGLSSVTVITGSTASVSPLNDFVSGPQGYTICGTSSTCFLK